MKKLITFFAGFMLLAITFATLYVTAAIFDAGQKSTIDTFFFQTNNLSSMRLGVPAHASDLGDSRLRDMLIKKFMYEYFYAVPDVENIAQRISGRTALRAMSSGSVFSDWKDGEAETIQELAENKSLRTIRVKTPIARPDGGDYWVVEYELRTWLHPNDMDAGPVITNGVMYLNIEPERGMTQLRETMNDKSLDVGRYLEDGGDPAAIFRFRVKAIERP